MTKIDERNDHGSPDNNLNRLLELGEPLPGMPEDLKARIRTRLAEMEPVPEKKNSFFQRWAIVSPLAAAAVLALFLIFIWPAGAPSNISWADVQRQLEQVHTMTFRSSVTIGKQVIQRGKVYHKDPGYVRSEEYVPDADLGNIESKPKSITIGRSEAGLNELLTLHPDSNRAEFVTTISRTNGSEPPTSQTINLASENWRLFKQITEDKTRRIGEQVINGKPAVGFNFDFPAREYIISDDAVGQGRAKIWVDRDDGVPMLIETEFQTAQGQEVLAETSDIQWNVPLEEGLFELSVPDGWSISRTRIEKAEYSGVWLAPGVTLEMSLDGQETLASARDVAGVVRALETTHNDSNIPELQITIGLRPEAAKRLRDYTNAHPEKIIVIDFNGQINVAGRLDAANPIQLNLDLSLLGLSLAELEEIYFTTSI